MSECVTRFLDDALGWYADGLVCDGIALSIDRITPNRYSRHTMQATLLCTLLALGQIQNSTVGQAEQLGIGIVLTDAGELYEGRIDQLGEFVRVTSGSRTNVLRKVNVAFTGETKDEAYEYLKKKKKPESASDAAGLAEWCRKHALPKLAVAEARLALKMKPDDRGLAKLLMDCEDDARREKPVIRVIGQGKKPDAPTPQAIQPMASATSYSPTAMPMSTVPVAIEQSFGKSVQQILMNNCANCHADPKREVKFRMVRLPEGVTVSPRTIENATAAIAQISPTNPLASPLLVKAYTAHGGRTNPSVDRSTVGYKNLEAWVVQAAAAMPKATAIPVAHEAVIVAPVVPATTTKLPDPIVPPMPEPVVKKNPDVKSVDPFDPAEFNRKK